MSEDELPFISRDASLQRAVVASLLGGLLIPPLQFGIGGPGGWVIIDNPEIHFGDDVFIPDLAAWLVERAPRPTRELYTSIVPDWIGEIGIAEPCVLVKKMQAYAAAGVRFVWQFEPRFKDVILLRLDDEREWEMYGAFGGSTGKTRVRSEPFDAVELDIDRIWGE
jgi:hypothetical protein